MPTITFYANKQDRFEVGQVYPTAFVQRIVVLDYAPTGDRVTISIPGIMEPKNARIVSDKNNVLTYQDMNNPFFRYEVETNPYDNTIVRVSIKVANEREYRYTL